MKGTRLPTGHLLALLVALVVLLPGSAAIGQTYSLGASTLVESPAGGSDSIILTVTPQTGVWTAVANDPWLQVAPASASGTGSGLVVFSFNDNAGATRVGTLTIAGLALTITQAGSTYAITNPGLIYEAARTPTAIVPTGLNQPSGVALDGSGNVYIADTGNKAIKEYSPATNAVTTLVSAGLNSPIGVAVDGASNVYILDVSFGKPSYTGAVYEYQPATNTITTLVLTAADSIYPTALAVDSAGDLFIAGTSISQASRGVTSGVIYEYSATTLGSTAYYNRDLADPTGLSVDQSGNVYIADPYEESLDEYTPATQTFTALANTGLANPPSLAVDCSGNLYFPDLYNNSILTYSPAAQALILPFIGGFGTPQGVAVDEAGNLYVADTGNNTIEEVPRAFVDTTAKTEPGTAGTDALPMVVPASATLTGPFAPSSNQSWLTIGAISNGVINFSFTANSGPARTAEITVLGQSVSVTQPFEPEPVIANGSVPLVGETTALLSGVENPMGVDATVMFQYGLTTSYGASTPPQAIGSGSDDVFFSGSATGLEAGTTYHYQIVTTSTAGTFYGPDGTFTTRPANAVSQILAMEGGAVPGAGTGGPGGVPSGAKWQSFGPPAIDLSGNVAFVGTWKTGSVIGGPGVFVDAALVARASGSAAGLTGVTYHRFGNPVLDSGSIAFTATLAGKGVVPGNAIGVFSDASGKLALVARMGDAAPGTSGSALYHSFNSLAVSGSTVAILAQLENAKGSSQVTSANNTGLWVDDPANGLSLVLREGQIIGGERIKTLTAFLAGNGSPGQGRGWLLSPNGAPQILALVTFTDNAQAVLSADDLANVTMLSHSGITGTSGSPGLAGAVFRSYGVPAADTSGGSAFLGTLKSGTAGVVAANASGIFEYDAGTSRYGAIARVTGSALGGGTFSLLKDVVLASDGSGLAFPAIITGTGIGGANASTLWWYPAGGPVALVARDGQPTLPEQHPPDVPSGAQWASFTSLGIAGGFGNGPIFSATLVAGRGGIPATGTAGVWGISSTGALRQFFRAGSVLDGKIISGFTFLTAVTGSPGVPRWFNESGEMVWLAAFRDGTQAIVETQAP